ncbi:hypothetical protein [Microcystis aeruginosa]
MSVGALIEFYFKLIICITIPEEPCFALLRIVVMDKIPSSAKVILHFFRER